MDVLLIVLAVIVVIAALAGVAFFFARKGRGTKKKTKSLIDSYIKERSKEQQSLNKELVNLDRLLAEKQIDSETYERLKNVLVTMKGKKNLDANDLFDYVAEKKKKLKKE